MGPALVNLAQKANFGLFLVDDKGMTLYEYTQDTANTSTCYDQCAAAWPPFLTNGAPQAGTGIDASLLGATTRKDGTVQVTYRGWPLYYWFRDEKPGDTKGQWVGGTWFAISPKGETITAGKPPAQSGANGNAGGANGSGNAAATASPVAAATAAPPSNAPAAGLAVKVAISNYAFAPKMLAVAPGTTVEWTNGDSTGHTVTAENGTFDSGNLDQGATFKFTFNQPGTYAYYCRYHGGAGGQGMSGQIIVK